MKFKSLLPCFLLGMSLAFQSCVPTFSELQSARLVGKGRFEMTPMYSTVSGADQKGPVHLQSHYGLHSSIGISQKMDLRLRTEIITYDGSDYSDWGAIIGFGPKWSLVENKMALSLPFGTSINENFMNEWEFQPSLLLTWPAISNKLDVTVNPKYVLTFCEDCQNLGAVNIGLAISSDLSSWAIRPEYGHLYDFGESGHAGQFSIGLSKTFGKGKE